MLAEKTEEGETVFLNLKWTISYINHMSEKEKAHAKEEEIPPLQQVLKVDVNKLVRCLIC